MNGVKGESCNPEKREAGRAVQLQKAEKGVVKDFACQSAQPPANLVGREVSKKTSLIIASFGS